jgi:hypothetical protein
LSLRVVEWRFRNKGLEGYYTREFRPSVLVVQEDLRPEARRARELEARGYEKMGRAFKWSEKFCYAAGSLREVDPDAVKALRATIEQAEPEWVRRVRKEWRGPWIVESIAYWSGVPLQATLAILLNLDDRGELNP